MSARNAPIWILVGTRPEVIKLAPVYAACTARLGKDQVALIGTGQHRELLHQALAPFGLQLDANLDIMREAQSLNDLAAAVLTGLQELITDYAVKPRWIVVQGDTTTAAMGALAAFHLGIRIAHVEAGLRSGNLAHPFPEEANRQIITRLADLHFAPTERAARVLRTEGIPAERIHLTGNTGIDSLLHVLSLPAPPASDELQSRLDLLRGEAVLITAHRRENNASAMDEWFAALAQFLASHPTLVFVMPQHPNALAKQAFEKHLANHARVVTAPAFDYPTTCRLLERCRFVVTDSGGLQEEAATLGVPVVVCRETTERPEAIDIGMAMLAGTKTARVLEAMEWAYEQGGQAHQRQWPFGDGLASERITDILTRILRESQT